MRLVTRLFLAVIATPIAAFAPHHRSSMLSSAVGSAPGRRITPTTTMTSPVSRPRIRPLTATNDDHDTTNHDTLDQYLDEINLRRALTYLKAHPDTPMTKERWNKIFHAISERTMNAEENTENLRADFPLESAARQEMTEMYQWLRQQGHLQLFGALPSGNNYLAAGSHVVAPDTMESILNLPMTALTPQPTNTVWLAGAAAAAAEIVASTVTGVPLAVWLTTTILGAVLDQAFLRGALLETFVKLFSPGVQSKILYHEAHHFLTAYLLGCPVEGIVLSAWAALADRRFGNRQVTAGTSFFDPELSDQINRGNLKRSAIDRYSIIVMAGIAAEAEQFGRADGGAGDEMALVGFLSRLNTGVSGTTGKTVWDAAAIKNQARWGALQASLMLREYRPAYEALVDALERGGTLGDCIFAMEQAAREHNLTTPAQPLGYLIKDAGTSEWVTELPELEPVASAPTPVATLNTTESLETLQGYRAAVEQRLREIDDELGRLQ